MDILLHSPSPTNLFQIPQLPEWTSPWPSSRVSLQELGRHFEDWRSFLELHLPFFFFPLPSSICYFVYQIVQARQIVYCLYLWVWEDHTNSSQDSLSPSAQSANAHLSSALNFVFAQQSITMIGSYLLLTCPESRCCRPMIVNLWTGEHLQPCGTRPATCPFGLTRMTFLQMGYIGHPC